MLLSSLIAHLDAVARLLPNLLSSELTIRDVDRGQLIDNGVEK